MAPRVLLLHSSGLSSRQWRRLARELAPTHEVLAPDLLGYDAPWPVGRPFHFQQDVERVREALGGRPAHLVGHSYGGLLGLQLALSDPGLVQSLVAYEPVAFSVLDRPEDAASRAELGALSAPYTPDASGVDEGWLRRFVDWWSGAGAWDAMSEDLRAGFRASGWKVGQEAVALLEDTTGSAGYARVQAPVLLLGGGRTPEPARRVLARLEEVLPHATRHVLPDAGHMGPLTHGGKVNAEVLAFLRER